MPPVMVCVEPVQPINSQCQGNAPVLAAGLDSKLMRVDPAAICALQELTQLVLVFLVLLVLSPLLDLQLVFPVLVVQNRAPTGPRAYLASLDSTLLVVLACPVPLIRCLLVMLAPAKYVHQVLKHQEMVEIAVLVQLIAFLVEMAFAFPALLVHLPPVQVLRHVYLVETIILPALADLNQ